MKKVRIISPIDGLSLDALELKSRRLFAFDNQDFECPAPFIIGRVGKEGLIRVTTDDARPKLHEIKSPDLLLIHHPKGKDREYWKLNTEEGVLGLWSPRYCNGFLIPEFTEGVIRYVVEFAYSGKDKIKLALENSSARDNLGFYVPMLENMIGGKIKR